MNRNIFGLIFGIYVVMMSFFTYRTHYIDDVTGFASTSNQGTATVNLTVACADRDGDGYFDDVQCPTGTDCNDYSDLINPGMIEICGNGIDDDCDGIQLDCSANEPGGGGGGGSGTSIDIERREDEADGNVEDQFFLDDDNFFIELPNFTKTQYADILFDRQNLEYTMLQGEYLVDSINLLSTNKDAMDVKVSVTGDAKNFVILNEESFIIKGFGKKQLKFAIAAPNTMNPGTYTGTLVFESNGKKVSANIKINLLATDNPFSIAITAESVFVGQEGIIDYVVGPVAVESDVLTMIRIFDPFTNLSLFEYSEVETFSGIHKASKSLKTTENTEPKRYLIKAEAYYTTESGSIIRADTVQFFVLRKKGFLFYARFPLLIILLLAVIMTGFSYMNAKKKSKFQILPTFISGMIHLGESFQTAIEFKNYTGQQQFLKVSLDGEISKIIKLANSNLIVDNNQDIRTIWVFSVDAGAAIGHYKGKIFVASSTLEEFIKVSLKVIQPE